MQASSFDSQGGQGEGFRCGGPQLPGNLRNLGYDEGPVQSWVSAVMLRLQTEVRKQESARQSPLKILHDELVQAATGLNNNVREIRKGREQ